MLVRALDSDHDWTFGASLNDYRAANLAAQQCIDTRLLSFVNDCFFDTTAGIDWIAFLGGSKNELALQLAIATVILNTPTSTADLTPVVVGISQLSVNLDRATRVFSVTYQVQTIFSVVSLTNTFTYTLGGSI
jgi:hypothetical protein